jgi:selenide,water dikinase
MLLADAQTSGGLLFAVEADATDDLVQGLRAAGTPAAAVVGEITDGGRGTILVT